MSYEDLRYNEVRQKSSHNAFQRYEGIYDQVIYWRIRSLEVDLHRGKPFRDALKNDWYIYHAPYVDPDTTVDLFSGFLQICRGIQLAMPEHEVITVFVDMKDKFHVTSSASQSAAAMDELIIGYLGVNNVYRPRDLLARKPGAWSLQDAVNARGWPTLEELRGKFLFVLTGGEDELATYASAGTARDRVCFLASSVSKAADVPGAQHIVFYNMSNNNLRFARDVYQAGFVSRAYYVDDSERWQSAVAHDCHHIATDKVNARVDTWAKTRRATGFPFQALRGSTPSTTEPGEVCGVWARSGDLWGQRDSFHYHYRNCSGNSKNEYTFFVSGPNSKVDDWVKGGVMARSSLADNAAYFGVFRVGEHHGLRIPAEKKVGPEGLIDADTLVLVKLNVKQGGKWAEAKGSIDGHEWTDLGSYGFTEPLKYQGIGVSSHGVERGAKFLFAIPNNGSRYGFNQSMFIGDKNGNHRGWVDWDGKRRWKVDRFAS
jgi:hypothetical protein